MIERVVFGETEFAIIVRGNLTASGVEFYTPPEYSQQLAGMRHPTGHRIRPHLHNQMQRSVKYTQEALFIRKGRLRVDFYSANAAKLGSRELGVGDVILLVTGGHGFEVLEEVEMIEVKQGPYIGEGDKSLISPPEAAL